MINPSGINPTEFKCLVEPMPVEEKTAGGIFIPEASKEKEKHATQDGILIAVSPIAFTYASAEEWAGNKPKPGARIAFVKYAGDRRKGKDGKDYLLISDKDIVATIED